MCEFDPKIQTSSWIQFYREQFVDLDEVEPNNFSLAKIWGCDQLDELEKELKVAQDKNYRQLILNAIYETSIQLQILSENTRFIGMYQSMQVVDNKLTENIEIIKRLPTSTFCSWQKIESFDDNQIEIETLGVQYQYESITQQDSEDDDDNK